MKTRNIALSAPPIFGLFACLLLGFPSSGLGGVEAWFNAEGQSIQARFYGIERGTVVLESQGRTYRIHPDLLAAESKLRAAHYQREALVWAREQLRQPMLPLEILAEIQRLIPDYVEGRTFTTFGHITRLRSEYSLEHTGLVRIQISDRFNLRTSFNDQIGYYRYGSGHQIEVIDEQVTISWRPYGRGEFRPVRFLLRRGDPVVFRVEVKRGDLEPIAILAGGNLRVADSHSARLWSDFLSDFHSNRNQYVQLLEQRNLARRISFIEYVLRGRPDPASFVEIVPRDFFGEDFQIEISEEVRQTMEVELTALRARVRR